MWQRLNYINVYIHVYVEDFVAVKSCPNLTFYYSWFDDTLSLNSLN